MLNNPFLHSSKITVTMNDILKRLGGKMFSNLIWKDFVWMGMFYDQLLHKNNRNSFIYSILTRALLHTCKKKKEGDLVFSWWKWILTCLLEVLAQHKLQAMSLDGFSLLLCSQNMPWIICIKLMSPTVGCYCYCCCISCCALYCLLPPSA